MKRIRASYSADNNAITADQAYYCNNRLAVVPAQLHLTDISMTMQGSPLVASLIHQYYILPGRISLQFVGR